MFKNSPKKYFEKLLSRHLNRISQHEFDYKLHILIENKYDFESNLCVAVNKKFRDIFELQSESTIESIYGELEAVMDDDPLIEDMRFLSNTTYFKLSDEFWDSIDNSSTTEEVDVLDLVQVKSEVDFEVKRLIFDFVKEGDCLVNIADFKGIFESVLSMGREDLGRMFFDMRKKKDRKFGRDEEETSVSLMQKRAEILNEILEKRYPGDVIFGLS